MSDQDIDKLFKNKLEDIQQHPSSGAWTKISGKLDKKQENSFPWLKIAAAVLLLLTASFFIWRSAGVSEQPAEIALEKEAPAILETEPRPDNPEVITDDASETLREEPVRKEIKKTPGVAPQATNQENLADATSSRPSEVKEEPSVPLELEETIALAEVTDAPENSIPRTVDTPETTLSSSTLSFSIEEFDDAEVQLAQAEMLPEEVDKDESGKSFWEILKQVKEPEKGLGDLREMKNNIIAFGNTKKESK